MKSLREVAEQHQGIDATALFDWGTPLLEGTLAAPGTLVTIGGHTGTGKSMLGLRLLDGIDFPALYVSLEDSFEVVAQRTRRAKRQDAVFVSVPLRPRLKYIADVIRQSYDALICPRLVYVDYIQVATSETSDTRTEEIGAIIAELKGLGRELGFVTLLGSQLKRPSPDNRYARPTRWDLRDSSNVENSSEVIVLLHETEESRDAGTVEAFIDKNKTGRAGATQWFERGRDGWLEPCHTPANSEAAGSRESYDPFK